MERFAIFGGRQSLKLNDKKITHIQKGHCTAYGNILVPSLGNQQIEWVFRIAKVNTSNGFVGVGIDYSGGRDKNHCFFLKGKGYGYQCDGIIIRPPHDSAHLGSNWDTQDQCIYERNHIETVSGDVITVRYDQKKAMLTFFNNGKEFSSMLNIKQGSDTKYNVAVFTSNVGDSVELIHFCQCTDNSVDESKEQQSNKANIEASQRSNKLSQLQIKHKQMQNVNTMQLNEIENLRQQLADKDQLNNEYQQQIKALRNENKQLTGKVNMLENEQKELLMENKNLKNENKELKLKCIDETKYETWSSDEIVSWIISLENNRYSKYEQILRISIAEEELTGEHLIDVNENDIKGWGIKNFGDKKNLCRKIKELVNKNNKNLNNFQQKINEGNAPTAYI